MKGLLEFGLSKLKISAYKDREHQVKLGEMQVMFNPEALDLSYGIDYDADNYLNGSISVNHFKKVRPGELQLELLFDASLPGNKPSVESQLTTLQSFCCETAPGTLETPYLKVEWGKMHWHGRDYFTGRAVSLQTRYTRFDRKAKPLRATVRLTLSADNSQPLKRAELAKLTERQARCTLPDMFWLPMTAATLATAAGAAGAYSYLAVASANDLDSLDAAQPGDTLIAPAEADGLEARA